MKQTLAEYSIVILANHHNPTILNPDFLLRTGIVNENFGWQLMAMPITTPAISTVQYDSNVAFTLEPVKLQISDTSGNPIQNSKIAEIASNYVKSLPHVEYTVLGINFTMTSTVKHVSKFLIERFLKEGEWNT